MGDDVDVEGIPTYYDEGFDKERKLIFFAEELLGETLDNLREKCGGTFSIPTVCNIAVQLVRSTSRFCLLKSNADGASIFKIGALEGLHSKGFALRDIAPKNVMTGKSSKVNKLYFIDLGCAKTFFKTGDKRLHVDPFKTKQSFEGTPIFGSIRGLKGEGQTRRDDLEALGYLLIFFAKGTLPWEGKENDFFFCAWILKSFFLESAKGVKKWTPKAYETLANQKSKVSLDELCSDLPSKKRNTKCFLKNHS